jgi:hypothetical protein
LYPAAAAAAVPVAAIVIKKSEAQQTKELTGVLHLFETRPLPKVVADKVFELLNIPFNKQEIVPYIPGTPSRDGRFFTHFNRIAGCIEVRDIQEKTMRIFEPDYPIPSSQWAHSEDGTIIVTANQTDKTTDIYQWNPAVNKYVKKTIQFWALNLKISRNGSTLALAGADPSIHIWNIATNTLLYTKPFNPLGAELGPLSDDGTFTIVYEETDSNCHVLNTRTHNLSPALPKGAYGLDSDMSGDGSTLLASYNMSPSPAKTSTWSCTQQAPLPDCQETGRLRVYKSPQLSRTGELLLTETTAGADHRITLWRTTTGKELRHFCSKSPAGGPHEFWRVAHLLDKEIRVVFECGTPKLQTLRIGPRPSYFEEAMKRFAPPVTPPRTVAAAVALALLPPPAMTLLQSPAAPGTT